MQALRLHDKLIDIYNISEALRIQENTMKETEPQL